MTTLDDWHLESYKDQLKARALGRLLPQVEADMIRRHADKDELRDETRLHPSEVCRDDWCPRASYYRFTGVAPETVEVFSTQTLNIFEAGDDIHTKWQRRFWNAGILVGRFTCLMCRHHWLAKSPDECPACKAPRPVLVYTEVPLFSEKYMLVAHSDAEIEDAQGKCLVEIKSVGLGTLRIESPLLYKRYSSGELTIEKLWREIKRPFLVHRRQGILYLHLRGLHEIQLVYEWKPTQAVKEFTVKYDSATIAPILTGCLAVVDGLKYKRTPKRPDWALDPNVPRCKSCAYYTHCWGEQRDPSSSSSSGGRRRVIVRATGPAEGVRAAAAPKR